MLGGWFEHDPCPNVAGGLKLPLPLLVMIGLELTGVSTGWTLNGVGRAVLVSQLGLPFAITWVTPITGFGVVWAR